MAENKNIGAIIQNSIYESVMDIYYKESAKNRYDITVTANIIDVSRKPEGIYRVRTDDAEFEAYATAGDYYKNDSVLVQVPNADYNNQKFILGRSMDEKVANQTFNFRLPFDNFIPLRQLNREEAVKEGAYWANYPSYKEELPAKYQFEKKLGTLVWEWNNTNSSTIGNTRLGIEADWQVLLGDYQPLRGTYGFSIVIKGLTSSTKTEAAPEIERIEYFTNRDMYGNTYAFYTPYSQQKVIDISDFLNIHSIKIYFYQDYSFVDGENNTIIYTDRDKYGHPAVPENILFSNTNIYLGISAEDIKDETVYLYSYDALGYNSEEEFIIDENNDKLPTGNWICDEEHELRMVWIHYEKDGTYSVIDNFDELLKQEKTSGKDTHIYWYRYNYNEVYDGLEQFFPGQEYEIKDGKYIPIIDELGYPVFENPDDEQQKEYRLLYKDILDAEENPDYESRISRYGGQNWNFLANLTDTFVNSVKPRGRFSREKFKIVVQHHGTKTQSKELVLINNHDVESQIAANARNDAIIIKTFKLVKEKDEDGNWIPGQYEAKEDGSLNAFYIYDENNTILVNEDNERFDQHEYYVQIWIRNEDTNDYELLRTVDDYGLPTGTNISWAFPTNYTMIRSSLEVNTNDAKYFKLDPSIDPVGYENFHNATMKFTIGSTLNNRYLDNDINVIIRKNGSEYHIKKELQFGRAESLGHEFLPVIEIIYPVGGHYLCNAENAEFQIGCVVYNKDGSLYETPQTLSFTWKELSGGQAKFYNTGKTYDEDPVDGYLIGEHHHRENNDFNIVGKMDDEVIIQYAEKYKKYKNNVVYGFLKSDSAPPIFEVTVYGAADYPLTVRKGFMMCNNPTYQAPRDFMLPSRVEFKSDGSNPIYYNRDFEIVYSNSYEENGDVKIKQSVEYPEWTINNNSILNLKPSKFNTKTIKVDTDGKRKEITESKNKYRLDFNTNGTPQWLDTYLTPSAYTYISYMDNGNKVSQSIAFDRNLYSSSLVNEWDGTSLTWDEENGAILSTMIAAGTKDSNNRFTGVMMGDWKSKGDESLDVPGMYGYEKGEQSFGFKTDGTAFLGKSGKGRIIFDGNESVIKSADENCYINLNPVNLSFDMDDINNQGFSENFLYCKVNKTNSSFSDAFDSIAGPDSWAREYFQDDEHDYFVVDSNYGVLTTGGVVARYGKLGNWMIGEEGLYQKTDNSYMYIGYDAKDNSSDNSVRYCIYAGQNFGTSNIPNATQQIGINPYFSVTWDGTLFARKGLIANTWTIDDTSLSYKVLTPKNIYDRIYIGKPESNTGIVEGDTSTNKNRWAISAGQSDRSEQNNYINFGVSLSGELYAQLGTIAGWGFDNSEFYSKGSKIRLLSDGYIYAGTPYTINGQNYYPITIDANQGLLSVMNMVQDSSGNIATSGYIYLGNYNLESSSVGSWTIPTNISTAATKPVVRVFGTDEEVRTSSTRWGEKLNYNIDTTTTFTSTGSVLTTNTVSLTSSNTFNIVARDNSGSYGISIVTGVQDSNGAKAIALYPKNVSASLASLGTKENPWNIYSNLIYCASLETAGALAAKTMLMNTELVATQPWVFEQLQSIYEALNQITGGGGGGGLAGSISGLSGSLAAKATVKVDKDASALDGTMNLIGKNIDDGVTWTVDRIAATNHAHYVSLSAGVLNIGMTRAMTDAGTKVDLNHTHNLSGSINSSGILSLTWSTTNFSDATGSSEIDLSAWLNAAKLEGWQKACDMITYTNNTVFGPSRSTYGAGGHTIAQYKPSSGSSGSAGSSQLKVNGTKYDYSINMVVSGQVDYSHFESSGGSYRASSFNWIGY